MRPTLIMPLKFLLLALFAFQPPQTTPPQTTMLECVFDASVPGPHGHEEILQMDEAQTVVLAFQPVEVQPKPDGWIAITVPPRTFHHETDRLRTTRRKTLVSRLRNRQFAPYLAVQGTK
jgi:hypothetical protein